MPRIHAGSRQRPWAARMKLHTPYRFSYTVATRSEALPIRKWPCVILGGGLVGHRKPGQIATDGPPTPGLLVPPYELQSSESRKAI